MIQLNQSGGDTPKRAKKGLRREKFLLLKAPYLATKSVWRTKQRAKQAVAVAAARQQVGHVEAIIRLIKQQQHQQRTQQGLPFKVNVHCLLAAD